jgi:peroxiredoxin
MAVQPFMRSKRWRRYLIVFVASLPLALTLRAALDKYLGPDLATATRAYVRRHKEPPLSEPLRQILTDPEFVPQPTQAHPLLGQPAADFTLTDDRQQPVSLERLRQEGPVVLIFYYGYYCSHCVAQLFSMQEDLALFRELGAQVVAVSADPPELTAKRYKEFGRFDFTVISDPENRLARQYGIYEPPAAGRPALLDHATFVIAPDGRVWWVNHGAEPFLDNKTLLVEVARAGGFGTPGPASTSPRQLASVR